LAEPRNNSHIPREESVALFVDLENIAIGARDAKIKIVNFDKILGRLVDKGKIVYKKAYCDFERYSSYRRPLNDLAIELVEMPMRKVDGKNSADIRMVVDAMDLCYSKHHIRIFVIASGDSDFSPLVSKLKENNKYTIGLGLKNSSSSRLIDNCDEFIYYEDIERGIDRIPDLSHLPEKTQRCFSLLISAYQALVRENHEIIWGSMLKQTMKRKQPTFTEDYYGYNSFSKLLEDAHRRKVLSIARDRRSGSYVIQSLGD